MAGLIVTLGLWLLFLFTILLSVFYLFVKNEFKYFEQRGIPYEKPGFPFGSFTDAILLKKSVTFILSNIYAKNRHRKLVGYYSLWRKQILLIDPEIIKSVLIKNCDIFQDRGVYFNKEKDPLSAHLFSLEGEDWKFLRAKLSPTFTPGRVKEMHPIFLECSELLSDIVEKHTSTSLGVECQSLFAKFAHTIISATAFGIDVSYCLGEKYSEFSKMIGKMVEPTFERLFTFILMFNCQVAKNLNIRLVPEDVSNYFINIVKKNIKYRKLNNITRNDYLQQLINIKRAEDMSIKLTEEDIAAQAFVFILAGSETASSAMSFCLYELSRNPEIQERLHQELDALSDLSYESIQGCQYLDMVLNETLRKYPPLGFLNRLCSRDFKVPGTDVIIEKGTQVLISVQGMQNDPQYFPEPEVFNPERFSIENKDNIKAYTYMPFGDGPRYCIGKKFGLMTMKTGLATLLRRYQVCSMDLLTSYDTVSLKMEPRAAITLVAGGLFLAFKDRT